MTIFDQIVPELVRICREHATLMERVQPVIINRDLNGRVRFVLNERWERDEKAREELSAFAKVAKDALGPHAYPPEQAFIFESDEELKCLLSQSPVFPLPGHEGIFVIDRLPTEGDWGKIEPETDVPRVVFFSIKGGVGRSTALAASAWALAEEGRRVLMVDLDLESPGLSTSLLPEDRRPRYGITDWLVEELVDNEGAVFNDMVALSELSQNGEIYVVPAYGSDPGEYVAKLARVWMPKITEDGGHTAWSARLRSLLDALERRWKPDVVLIDSRSGIDEIAAACVTDLGAMLILLFALEGDQTWSDYQILFHYWKTRGAAEKIRERLRVVAAMVPSGPKGGGEYLGRLRERAWDLFCQELYDRLEPEVLPGEDLFSFDLVDESGPHYPWHVLWDDSFSAIQNLHGVLQEVDKARVQTTFGPLVDGLKTWCFNDENR